MDSSAGHSELMPQEKGKGKLKMKTEGWGTA
jgi:hypothetical protein